MTTLSPRRGESMRPGPLRGEGGQVTFFGLGLILALLFLGGVSLDLWRVVAERRALAEVADAAAGAGGNGIDPTVVWTQAEPRLDPALAEAIAWDNLRRQPDPGAMTDAAVAATPDAVEVVVRGEVRFTLLAVFTAGEPVTLEVRATARPARGGE